ncbi:MAG: TlyA family RNA methyltransferase [Alphaproteobacteria bacterium]|jgi:23S rRNA (cytidine1920-2'-O)/16S rRNA (cytidine1409-2'-O)-methyltransferase|nr:TlyA family RNA methyltransferase [Alphaproteobacteria bacterium]
MTGPGRQRADALLHARGLAESRTRAQALIEAGLVYSGEARIGKPGQRLAADAPLEVRGLDHPWVSRGGIKLDHALTYFGIEPNGLVCLDLGASTGGFTDVLLGRGAAKVYAVDVGRDQIAAKLRGDARVVVLEQTDARALTAELISEPIDLIVADLAFIGIEKALPAALDLTRSGAKPETCLVALIKPQFQAGPDDVGKGGVVRDPAVLERVCREVQDWLEGEAGWRVLGLVESPVPGGDGNTEFLIAAVKP